MDFKFKINCPRVLENMSPTSESRKHLSQFNRCKYTKISINTHRKNNFQNNRLRISTLSKNNVELSSQEAYRRRQGLCFSIFCLIFLWEIFMCFWQWRFLYQLELLVFQDIHYCHIQKGESFAFADCFSSKFFFVNQAAGRMFSQ